MKTFILVFCLFLFFTPSTYAQESYNEAIYKGLDAMVDSVLTQEEANDLKGEAELLLIFYELNKLPCTTTIAYILVESEDKAPVKKFNMTVEDYKGSYVYVSEHIKEPAAIWIDESFNEIGAYKVTLHKKNNPIPSDKTSTFRILEEGCNFVFQKLILAD